jgi:hypothetical protein
MKQPSRVPSTAIHVFRSTASLPERDAGFEEGFVVVVAMLLLRLARCDSDGRRHAGRYEILVSLDTVLIEHDLDWNSLNDLGEVSGSVIRWKQCKLVSRTRSKAVNVTVKGMARKRIDFHLNLLSGAHLFELGFLIVRYDPKPVLHHGHERLADLNPLPGGGRRSSQGI